MRSDDLDRHSVTNLSGGAGPRERGPAIRAAGEARPPRVLVYASSSLVGVGLIELLPPSWRDRAVLAVAPAGLDGSDDGDALEGIVGDAAEASLNAAVVELATAGAYEVVTVTRSLGASAILLLASPEDDLDSVLAEAADAILLRDEVDARTLRMALAAGALGLRVTPRGLPVGMGVSRAGVGSGDPARVQLGEPAQRALELLADGLRDAEIALELNLSESATRKLIQRAVRRTGARTRCQAVAAAVRGGELR